MPVNKSTGPLKFFNVVFSFTEQNVTVGTVAAETEDAARIKIMEQIGPQVENLVITSVTEVAQENNAPVDLNDLPEGVVKFKH